MKDTFSLIHRLEALEKQKEDLKKQKEDCQPKGTREKLDNQIRKVRAELAKRGYTPEQQQPGLLAAWAVYVETGIDGLTEIITAAANADETEQSLEIGNLHFGLKGAEIILHMQRGVDGVSFNLEDVETVLGTFYDRPTALAARYTCQKRKSDGESNMLLERLIQLGINPSKCNPLERAIILANKSEIKGLLRNRRKNGGVHPKRYVTVPQSQNIADEPKRAASHKGTRPEKQYKTDYCAKRGGKAPKTIKRKLWKMGIPDTNPEELQRALNELEGAKRRRNERRRRYRNARTLSESHIPAAEPATDIVVTMHDKILMDRIPHWKEVVTDPAYKEIMDNPTLRALATTETF